MTMSLTMPELGNFYGTVSAFVGKYGLTLIS